VDCQVQLCFDQRMAKNQRRPKPKRLTERGAYTRARIIDAAAGLVATRGVAGTSLDQIMEASATSKSQLYRYFADKDALMCAVVRAQADRVIGFQESCLKGITSLAELQSWRGTVVKRNRASGGVGGCPIGSLASELADRSESARELLATSFQTCESHLVFGLKAMIDRGEVSADADPCDLATSIMSALQGGLLLAQTHRTTRPLELALDMALNHIPRGLAQSDTQALCRNIPSRMEAPEKWS
jgi:TetR/AcrR family transcriptional repressor of nem operon